VVRSQANNEMREQKIREMTDIYNEIADKILPPLRRVEVSMICNKNNFNDEQIAEMMRTNPDTLSANEKMYAASMEQDLEKKASIYNTIVEKESSDWRGYNNLAVLQANDYIQNGTSASLTNALKNLEKAAAISPDNGIILNNKAICEFLNGEKEAAMQDFAAAEKAAVNPVEEDYNLALTKIKAGDYAGAAKDMNNKSCDYNMALVQMLNKDYTNAAKTLDCVAQKDAKTYYLRAVLAARMKDENKVYTNLTECVKLDASYKRKAKKDAEFKKYKNTDRFQEIVK
jgi:Flp pilus assembly protein TadD